MAALAPLEELVRLQLPDLRNPARMPSWPAWLVSRLAVLRNEAQPDPITGKWREVATLPASSILKANEREAIEQHTAALLALCERTPANDQDAESETLVDLTKMLLVLPSTLQNELSAEAVIEAFADALADIPSWATRAAIRRWYRGDAGNDARGQRRDCHWRPAPADLREVAFAELWRVRGRAMDLQNLLRAEPLIEYGDEHCQRMRGKLANLFRNFGSTLVGKDGSGEVADASPPSANCGNSSNATPGPRGTRVMSGEMEIVESRC